MAIDPIFAAAVARGLPAANVLRAMSPSQFLQTLEEFGVIPAWNIQQSQAAAYVTRMTQMPPGSPQFTRAVDAIMQSESKRGISGLSRRAAQRFATIVDIGGDIKKELIWIVEGDSSTCDPCRENAAIVHTFEEWQQIGMPGLDTCDGGERCRCELFPLEKGE